tara:strand:- start:1662 stop:1838 length:177 start_codon:yes stop_codon:yes gene_type:complete
MNKVEVVSREYAKKCPKTHTEHKNNHNIRRSLRLIGKSLTSDIEIAVKALLELKNVRN